MAYNYIQFELENRTAYITLNRPDKLNSFHADMAREMQEVLDVVSGKKEIRCVVLRAEGRAFSAGQDLKEAVEKSKDEQFELSEIVEHHYNPIILGLRRLEKPVICAVQGTAAGAGANIALACDIVLASRKATFIQSFSSIALVPDSGGTWMLPRLVGMARATAIMMTAEEVSADQAESMGMIYKAVYDQHLASETRKIADKLSQMPTQSMAMIKKALNRSFDNDLESQLSLEAELQTRAGKTNDYREGVNAFLEKRQPNYKGH